MMVIISILVLGVLGFVFATLLGLVADYFKIEEDPRVTGILTLLPGTNCGACGSASCHHFAERLLKGEVSVNGCVSGGQNVAKRLAEFMGVEELSVHKKIAAVHCGAKARQRKKKANYSGIKTCMAMSLVDSGGLLCSYGCLGQGDCFSVCSFDAIVMKEGLPVIDAEKCTACGKCIVACPRNIISLIPYDFRIAVACSSHGRGAETRKSCEVGCIGCKICEKEVPAAFKVVDNLAIMDYSKGAVDCFSAIEKCPTKCIVKL